MSVLPFSSPAGCTRVQKEADDVPCELETTLQRNQIQFTFRISLPSQFVPQEEQSDQILKSQSSDHEVLGISSCLLRAPVFLFQNLGTQQYRNPLVILGGLADFVHKLLRVGTEKWCAVRKVYKLPEP